MRVAFALLIGTIFSCAAAAQTPEKAPYLDINPPQLVTETKKLEVVEVFSYGCIHCAHFQENIDRWRVRLDTKKIEFVYLPATFNQLFLALARGYYAAQSLGVVEKTHHEVFNAIHERNYPIRSFNDVVNLYAGLGVDRDQFENATKSFLVETEVKRANDLMAQFRIDGTPTLIVAGKYRITVDSAGSQENMIKIADQLIAQELGQSKGTSRQAPNKGK
jgi:thiol:disulfide interchange protein DsbA